MNRSESDTRLFLKQVPEIKEALRCSAVMIGVDDYGSGRGYESRATGERNDQNGLLI